MSLTIVAANVGLSDTYEVNYDIVEVGEPIGHSVPVIINAANKYMKAANTSQTSAEVKGITITSAAAIGDFVVIVTGGPMLIGATIVAGTLYGLGASGLVEAIADWTTGDWQTYLGYGGTSSELVVQISATGTQK